MLGLLLVLISVTQKVVSASSVHVIRLLEVRQGPWGQWALQGAVIDEPTAI